MAADVGIRVLSMGFEGSGTKKPEKVSVIKNETFDCVHD